MNISQRTRTKSAQNPHCHHLRHNFHHLRWLWSNDPRLSDSNSNSSFPILSCCCAMICKACAICCMDSAICACCCMMISSGGGVVDIVELWSGSGSTSIVWRYLVASVLLICAMVCFCSYPLAMSCNAFIASLLYFFVLPCLIAGMYSANESR